jgi:hypothetical protein
MAMTVGVSEANPNAKQESYLMLGAAKLTPTCARYRLHWLSLFSLGNALLCLQWQTLKPFLFS